MTKIDCSKQSCKAERKITEFIPEEDIHQEKTCEELTCANAQEKKVKDLSQGLTALENILKNMTGLCRKPNCPADEDNAPRSCAIDVKEKEGLMPTLPLPNRYLIDEYELKQKYEAKGDKKEYKTLRDILKLEEFEDVKICKGPTCYGGLMGITNFPTATSTSSKMCSDKTCMPGGTSSRQCGSTVCPFRRDKPRTPVDNKGDGERGSKLQSTVPSPGYGGTTGTNKLYGNVNFNLDTTPCKLDTCPYTTGKTDKFGSSALPAMPPSSFGTAGLTSSYGGGGLSSSYGTAGLSSAPCKFDTCPLTTGKSAVPASSFGTAGLTSSYGGGGLSSSYGTAGLTSSAPCTFNTCPYTTGKSAVPASSYGTAGLSSTFGTSGFGGKKLDSAWCNLDNCPFAPNTGNNASQAITAGKSPCGNPSCQYTYDSTSAPAATSPYNDFGASSPAGNQGAAPCGKPTCPYKDSSAAPSAGNQGVSPCGQPTCPYKDTYDEPAGNVGPCGSPVCPMIATTSPGALQPCPYAGQTKRYPCGSPSCPYVNPSGMLITHEYTNDTSFVQEAARPYCGSASPYDYMASMTPQYPAPYGKNYQMFTCTEPPPPNPCPYLPKKKKKSCGNPKCPYAKKRKEKDNFCVDKTCPFGTGICGGPPQFSCDKPEVIPCENPDCPIHQAKTRKKKEPCDSDSCPYSTGVCGGPKMFSCDSPDVEHCETPECPVHKQDVNTCPKTCPYSEGICGGPKIFSCDNPEVFPCGGPDCPVHGKKKKKKKKKCKCCGKSKKSSCICGGEPEEPEEPDGICGAPKKYSCDSPDVEPCETPECPIHKQNVNTCPKTCPYSEGICGGPRIFSCDSPEVFPCGSPECPMSPADDDVCSCCGERKKKKKRKKCPYARDDASSPPYNPVGDGDNKCSTKTCPYMKKLVFCDDCGGVLPDELNSSSSSDSSNTTSSEVETEEKPARGSVAKSTGSVDKSKGSLVKSVAKSKGSVAKDKEPIPSATNALVPVKKGNGELPEEEAPPSLYDYPGVQIGHKDCRYVRKLIPKNMGWLWNIVPYWGKAEFWRGYKPGAILKSVYKMMKKHRKDYDPNMLKKKTKSKHRMEDRHCIEVTQKEGDYHITVNPVKDPKNRNPAESPYMDVTPLQFKVERPIEEPYGYCPCDELIDEDVPSGKSSEFQFHFSPPAAVPDPIPTKKKKAKAEISVQYDITDIPKELRGKGGSKKDGKKGGKKGGKKKK